MKHIFNILLVSLMILSLALTGAMAEGEHRVAKDGAQIQTDDPTMPTRVPMEGGTKILMHFGDMVWIHGCAYAIELSELFNHAEETLVTGREPD